MIKHVVMFKLKEFDSPSSKAEKLAEIKKGLEDLVEKIDVLKSMRVGVNVNPSEIYDFVLISEFDSLEDVDIYAKHPDHVAIAKVIGEVKESRSGIDFAL